VRGDSGWRSFRDCQDRLPMVHFHHAEWIQQPWVEMFLEKCAKDVQEARKKRRGSNQQPPRDLGDCAGKKVRGNFLKLPNTALLVVICREPKDNNDQTFSNQLYASYIDVRDWAELIDIIEKQLWPKSAILSECDIEMQLVTGRIAQRVPGIISTWVHDECPSIWSDLIQQISF